MNDKWNISESNKNTFHTSKTVWNSETVGVLLCITPYFIAYENTTKSTEPKWLGLIAVQSWSRKNMVVQNTAIFFGPWTKKAKKSSTDALYTRILKKQTKTVRYPQTALRDLVRREFQSLCDLVKLHH